MPVVFALLHHLLELCLTPMSPHACIWMMLLADILLMITFIFDLMILATLAGSASSPVIHPNVVWKC